MYSELSPIVGVAYETYETKINECLEQCCVSYVHQIYV